MTVASPDTMTTLDEIIDNFSLLEEWDDRYRYVIELGRGMDPLSERDRVEANKVQGCASQVWLATTVRCNGQGGPVLTFSGDSDAHIVRGLIAILFAMFSGKQASEILSADAITLFESETKSSGSVYRELHKISFKTGQNTGSEGSERQTQPVELDANRRSSEPDTDDGWPRGQGPTDL